MRQLITVVLAAALLTVMSACGGGGGVTLSGGQTATGGTGNLTAGNWMLTATSQVPDSSGNIDYVYLRGAVATSGNAVAATFRPDSGCLLSFDVSPFGDPVGFSGSVTDGNITLTSAMVNGSTATMTGSLINGTTISGSYSSLGGANSHYASNGLCNGNLGTLSGVYIAPVNSTWAGVLANYSGYFGITCGGGNSCNGANLSNGKISSNYLPDAFTPFSDGALVLQLAAGPPTPVSASSAENNDTLSGFAASINALPIGIKASVATDPTGARLSLVDATGAGNVVTISNNTTGLVFPDTINVTASLTQASTANPDGTFTLNGTVTARAQSLPCYASSGAIDSTQSFIEGDTLHITTVINNGYTLSLTPALLLNPNTSLKMSIPSATSTSGGCAGYIATGTLCQLDSNGNCLTQVATGMAATNSIMRQSGAGPRSQQLPGLKP